MHKDISKTPTDDLTIEVRIYDWSYVSTRDHGSWFYFTVQDKREFQGNFDFRNEKAAELYAHLKDDPKNQPYYVREDKVADIITFSSIGSRQDQQKQMEHERSLWE